MNSECPRTVNRLCVVVIAVPPNYRGGCAPSDADTTASGEYASCRLARSCGVRRCRIQIRRTALNVVVMVGLLLGRAAYPNPSVKNVDSSEDSPSNEQQGMRQLLSMRTIAGYHGRASPPCRRGARGRLLQEQRPRERKLPNNERRPARTPLVRASALRDVSVSGSHFGSSLSPGRPVLTLGVSRRRQISGLYSRRSLT